MARIVLTCWGSHGDVDPFLGLALELRARGHDVTIATMEFFRSVITGHGIGFHPIRPSADPSDGALIQRIMDPRRGPERLLNEFVFPGVGDMYDDLSPCVREADLLLSHPLTFATPILAEVHGIPWASAVLAPTSFFSAFDIPVMPQAPWLKRSGRFGHLLGAIFVRAVHGITRSWPNPVYQLRARLGLARGANPIFEGQHSPHLVLALFSKLLADPQPDWPQNTVVTGHVFNDTPHGTALPLELVRFLDQGPPPIVFTLGSSVVRAAGSFWDESIAAVRRMGARAVFLVGPDRLAAIQASLPPGCLAIDRAPHSLLFPRAAVIVHQCGVGTLGQGLRSGRPVLAIPFAHDQPDNAWRAARLGTARVLSPAAYRAPRIAAELATLIGDTSYRAAAERASELMSGERGAMAACDALERMIGRVRH